MDEIEITPLGNRQLQVEVRTGNAETTHRVDVPERLSEGLVIPEDDLERAVRASFEFLLEREPATSILGRFSLTDITRYFPEYPTELARRLS